MKQDVKLNFLSSPAGTPQAFSPSRLDHLVETMGEKAFCRLAAEHLVALARPEAALPGNLGTFRLLLRDGIVFFLSRMSYPRLRASIVSQANLPRNSGPGERLLHLALNFPTLHKLGQIVARNPGLDPSLKKWLVRLEHGVVRSNPIDLLETICKQLSPEDSAIEVQLTPRILAEASVAAVVPFTWSEPGAIDPIDGVFKILKKNIAAHLDEELRILSETVAFLENDRAKYGLRELMLSELFAEVRESMAKEIDLAAEREHLEEAARIYAKVRKIRIPRLFSFQSPGLTSMEYLDGVRITDADFCTEQRRALARLVFEAVICIPLFAAEDSALFHGDPHAGNILSVSTAEGPAVALIDWTLADRLSKVQRGQIVEMMIGVSIGDSKRAGEAIEQLCGGTRGGADIERLLASALVHDDPIKVGFHLLEEMTMAGMVMPPELILFRKAFFTLEGVLNDLAPDFSMFEAMSDYVGGLLLAELPERLGSGFLPLVDTALQHRSLLSNEALANLGLHHSLTIWEKAMSFQFALFAAQTRFSTDFLRSMTVPPWA